jgi:transposase-like protein
MRKKRHNYTPEEMVAILRRHLVDHVLVSDLCDEYQLQPTTFYNWQKQFFVQGAAAFTRQSSAVKATEATEVKQLKERFRTEEKLQRKHEVLSELVEEHVKHKERDRKLEEAREQRRMKRQQATAEDDYSGIAGIPLTQAA